MQCALCAVVSGDLEACRVYQDDAVMAFLDSAPAVRGHLVIVPRIHGMSLEELDPQDAGRMMRVGQQLACVLQEVVGADRVNLWLVDKPTIGHELFHAHMHLVPRTVGADFTAPTPLREPCHETLDEVAEQIRSALQTRQSQPAWAHRPR